jgi:hypothetical protein
LPLRPGYWLAVAALCLLVPNPVPISITVLEPIDLRARTAHIEDPESRIEAAHALVHGALAKAVGGR